MKAQSTIYIQLQNIYKSKARQDAAEVLEIVRKHPRGKDIDITEVENFCKNAAFIKLIQSTDNTTSNLQAVLGMYFSSHASTNAC